MNALDQFNRKDEQAKYSLESQKLSQYIENLHENENNKTKWIWELIQNAKDTENSLQKTSIKIIVTDKEFIFSHNANPFTPSELNTVTSQYSSKSEENN